VYSNYDIDFFKDIEQNPRWFVGGGGFSLRSKKLLTALQDERIIPFFSAVDKQTKKERKLVSEDFTICLQYRDILEQDYGIKFAPIDVDKAAGVRLGHIQFGRNGDYPDDHLFGRRSKATCEPFCATAVVGPRVEQV
jgi:hypothetical protein